jgi:hypothetical protein
VELVGIEPLGILKTGKLLDRRKRYNASQSPNWILQFTLAQNYSRPKTYAHTILAVITGLSQSEIFRLS